jgi:hypothetical protein
VEDEVERVLQSELRLLQHLLREGPGVHFMRQLRPDVTDNT